MGSFQIIEPSPLHDIVRPFGPSPPLGEMPKAEGGISSAVRPVLRFSK